MNGQFFIEVDITPTVISQSTKPNLHFWDNYLTESLAAPVLRKARSRRGKKKSKLKGN